ncbi:cytochrome C [Niastella caeni]|uniref:Cytochrome C n=1 Tax=Niastella caeni TaxID=2569763 RepID=A0A4V4H0W2_9BACT|nr:heme-binding domain-containing protein [Niastella caeni]THU38136.1 cytochrome C [Niastella caeni]
MRKSRRWLLIFLTLFILIQFIRPARNQSGQVLQTDITKTFSVPFKVKTVLEVACYDCHSNNTRYPWYANLQPGGWWLAKHVKEGKEELNFSEFGSYSRRRQITKLRSIENSINDGAMPLSSYTLLHQNARLTSDEKALIVAWVNKIKDSITATY